MRNRTRKSASIQPRTSLGKSHEAEEYFVVVFRFYREEAAFSATPALPRRDRPSAALASNRIRKGPADALSEMLRASVRTIASVLHTQSMDIWECAKMTEVSAGCAIGFLTRAQAEPWSPRRDTYLKIKVKIKHLQKLELNMFPVKIKHSLDKKFSKFDQQLKKVFVKFCEISGLDRCKGFYIL